MDPQDEDNVSALLRNTMYNHDPLQLLRHDPPPLLPIPAAPPPPTHPTNDINPPLPSNNHHPPATSNQWNDIMPNIYLNNDNDSEQVTAFTNHNLRTNDFWGDDSNTLKAPNSARLYFQNVNGLKGLKDDGVSYREFLQHMVNVQADIIGISEHNLCTRQSETWEIMKKITSQFWRINHLQMSSSDSVTPTRYKAGGTALITQGNLTGRLYKKGNDKMGRWSYIKLVGKRQRIITIISVYQLVNQTKRGDGTVWTQHCKTLREKGIQDPNPRTQFQKDFKSFLTKCHSQHEYIIIGGDLNETLGTQASPTTRLCNEFGLVDPMLRRHGNDPGISTYHRGRSRIDYILCSEDILPMITSIGVEPFHERYPSDHRGLHMDLDIQQLFGNAPSTMVSAPLRDVRSSLPTDVDMYCNSLDKYLKEHQVYDRIHHLATLDDTTMDHHYAEQLDRDITRGMIHAGKQCSKKKSTPWSPVLRHAQQRVTVYQKCLTRLRNNLPCERQIDQAQKQLPFPLILPTTTRTCKALLLQAQVEVRNIVRDAQAHRQDHQENQLLKHSVENDDDDNMSKLRRRIKRAEELKRTYNKLKRIRGLCHNGGLTKILVPRDPTQDPKTVTQLQDWKVLSEPSDIDDHLRARNRKHFGQAQGTPFTVHPLQTDLNFEATTQQAEAVLTGDYHPEAITAMTQSMIDHMKYKAPKDTIPNEITTKQFISRFKNWRESTTTSPSGRHLGHYKVLVSTLYMADSDAQSAMEAIRERIIEVHVQMINYALRSGYCYHRWQEVVNVMIEKEPGNPAIHRLRVLHLYEADYNFLLASKWRSMVYYNESHHNFNDGQYGSRPGRTAMDPVFIEELQMEISRAFRKRHLKFANDATSCYDRIIPSFANLCLRKYGMHTKITQLHGSMLRQARYKLKTMLGVSNQCYVYEIDHPIYGTGQGSGGSPGCWLVVSSTAFDCHEEHGTGATYVSPNRQESITIHLIGFVDDTCSQNNDFTADTQPTAAQLIELARHDAQLWDELLQITGGALELSKCTFHLVEYDFMTNGTPILLSGKSPQNQLTIPSGTTTTTIHQLSSYAAVKTLGCYKLPSGGQKVQYAQMKSKSDQYASIIHRSNCTPDETWTFFNAIYSPSVGYPLPVCHFTQPQLDRIQSKAINAVLSKGGYNSKTSRNIVYGPRKYGGLGMRTLYVEQGLGQIQLFLKHWRTNTQASHMLRIAYHWHNHATGVSTPLLASPYRVLPYLESQWIRSLRQFLAHIDGAIIVDEPGIFPCQRINDFYLMDDISMTDDMTPKEQRLFNYCRLWLRVTLISDITNAEGTHLLPFIDQGTRHPDQSESHWMYPNQAKPDGAGWRAWRKGLKQWSTNGRLFEPLGQWHSTLQIQRPWQYSPTTNTLFHHTPTSIQQHKSKYKSHRIPIFDRTCSTTVSHVPSDCFPVDTSLSFTECTILSSIVNQRQPTVLLPVAATFDDFVQCLAPWERELISEITTTHDIFTTCAAIFTALTINVSDGSIIDATGTFGWIIGDIKGKILVKGKGQIRGYRNTSFRAEGYGMLALLRFLLRMIEFCRLHHPASFPTTALYSDNQALIIRINTAANRRFDNANLTLEADWDITTAIHHTLHALPLQCTIQHVKGHQDRHRPIHRLPIPAQYNVHADHLATERMHDSTRPISQVLLNPYEKAQLQINSNSITSRYKSRVREAATGPNLLQHLKDRHSWDDKILETIHWDCHAAALNRSHTHRKTITKMIHDILPTGVHLHRQQDYYPEACPGCKATAETSAHILLCVDPRRAQWRTNFHRELQNHCTSKDTDPNLARLLLHGIQAQLTEQREPIIGEYPFYCRAIIQQQSAIGWSQLLCGRFTSAWSKTQTSYLHRNGLYHDKCNGDLWTTSTISFIWRHWYDLWLIRNDQKHGRDSTREAQQRRAQALRHLAHLYKYQDQVLPSDREVFLESLAVHQQKSTYVITTWIANHSGIIKQSVKTAAAQAIAHTTPIYTHFGGTKPSRKPTPKAKANQRRRNRLGGSTQSRSLHDYGFSSSRRNPP